MLIGNYLFFCIYFYIFQHIAPGDYPKLLFYTKVVEIQKNSKQKQN